MIHICVAHTTDITDNIISTDISHTYDILIDEETIATPIFADTLRNSIFDWKYKTTKQKYACLAHKDSVSSHYILHVLQYIA